MSDDVSSQLSVMKDLLTPEKLASLSPIQRDEVIDLIQGIRNFCCQGEISR